MHYKVIFTLFLLINSVLTHKALAKSNRILLCLAKEEGLLHKSHNTGPQYHLNQLLINELSSFNTVRLKDKYYEQICLNKKEAPSVSLLRSLIINGKDNFDLYSSGLEVSSVAMSKATIEEFLSNTPKIFFNYLSSLLALTPTADCFAKNIPELNFFLEQFHYLEEQVPRERLLENKARLHKIFDKVSHLDQIIHKCKINKSKKKS